MYRKSEEYSWAENEFGSAELGDIRRTRRLVQIAAGAAGEVGAALSSVCGGSGAQAVSRLFSREETTLDSVLECHKRQLGSRSSGEECLLAVQDTTMLDFSRHRSTVGLGPLGSDHGLGLLMHSVLAVNEEGVPLGIMGEQIWARDSSQTGSRYNRRSKRTEDKESAKWLRGLEQAQSTTPSSMSVIVIGDRESDVYALFAAPRRENVDLLVRLAYNRAVVDNDAGYVRDAINSADVVGSYEIDVPRQGSRKARKARLEVRITSVWLKRPINNKIDMLPERIRVQVVQAVEVDAPDGVDFLNWILLTTCKIDNFAEAYRAIRRYSRRWIIEEFHRVLKSGCRVEQMQFESTESILPAIALLSIVAWRVLHLTKIARTSPQAEASQVADADELAALSSWLHSKGCKDYVIQTVSQFTVAVARLGGFLGRKSDGMPGTKTIWQGLRNLEMLVAGYTLAAQYKNVIQD